MRIGICGPFNPYAVKEFFPESLVIPSINKSASAVNTYVRELLRQGHDVVVFTSTVPSKNKHNLLYVGKHIKVIIVHSNPGLFLSHVFSRLYMINRLRCIIDDYVSTLDVLHAQWTYDFALAAKQFKRQLPVFCTIRDWCPYIVSVTKGLKRIQWRLYERLFNRVVKDDELHFIANSEYTYKCFKDYLPNRDASIIYNPIDKQYILPISSRKEESIPKMVFISICDNASERRKNISSLLEAFRLFHNKYPDSKLKLVGRGFAKESSICKEWDMNSLLGGVELMGYVDHTTLMATIDTCSCLVHPSLEETFGNILLEGMARRVIVIGGVDSGAVPIVLGGGKYGILCDITNPEDIFYAMELSLDKCYISDRINAATERLLSTYSSDVIVHKHLSLYRYFIDTFPLPEAGNE